MKDLIIYWVKSTYLLAVIFFAGLAFILADLNVGLWQGLDVRAHCELDYQKFDVQTYDLKTWTSKCISAGGSEALLRQGR
ncbi:MAG: hypothetical protein A0129_12220 [Limnobacter sp. CACIAM 66H1]|uniref:hypothetical protein n=1 Tax=Limnobacter sp. CACIAM 66H1 TaxID=1813033 RepID=UPI0007A807C0|nr:hypothetical protein [Limnobacter sp. CACIAM 66H1]KYP10556.1 MAG: hypothetical protein A0129_12220 [Limnobacter sp. CACIAM 66H1]